MTGGTRLFTVLQHWDSFFPGGLTSFSWGLEQLFEERRIADAAGLIRFIEAELRFRWASFDRAWHPEDFAIGKYDGECCRTNRASR